VIVLTTLTLMTVCKVLTVCKVGRTRIVCSLGSVRSHKHKRKFKNANSCQVWCC
jgi:hypothetical protein